MTETRLAPESLTTCFVRDAVLPALNLCAVHRDRLPEGLAADPAPALDDPYDGPLHRLSRKDSGTEIHHLCNVTFASLRPVTLRKR